MARTNEDSRGTLGLAGNAICVKIGVTAMWASSRETQFVTISLFLKKQSCIKGFHPFCCLAKSKEQRQGIHFSKIYQECNQKKNGCLKDKLQNNRACRIYRYTRFSLYHSQKGPCKTVPVLSGRGIKIVTSMLDATLGPNGNSRSSKRLASCFGCIYKRQNRMEDSLTVSSNQGQDGRLVMLFVPNYTKFLEW